MSATTAIRSTSWIERSVARVRDELAEEHRADEEERRVGHRDPVGEPHPEEGDEDGRGDGEDRGAEV